MIRVPSPAVFKHKAFRNFWFARLFSTLALQIQVTAMGWQAYDTARAHGQRIEEAALVLGLLGLVQFLPLLALSLFGGQAADRYNRKWIILAGLGVRGATALMLLAVAQLPGDTTMKFIFGAALLAGVVNAFLPAALSALLPTLVSREDLPQAIAWNSLCFQSGVIIGPAIGGLLYGLGAEAPYAASCALLAIGVGLLAATHAPKQERVAEARTVGMIVEGLKFVLNNKIVLGAISLDLIVVLLAGAVALLPAFARDILHAGPDEMGVLRAAMGVGAVIVAIGLAARPIRANVGLWMFGATIVFGLATIVFGLSRSFWLTAFALAVAGGADMISVYVRQTLIQLATPDAMRGRVGAVSYVFISASNELGDFEAGLTARLLGPTIAVAAGGIAAVGASLAWMRLFPQLARADGFEPDKYETTQPAPEAETPRA
jgi:MFS family permease